MRNILSFICFSLLILSVWPKTAEEWKSRVLYQLMTDRFARTDGSAPECPDLLDYCGGTFKGIEKNLDYIQEMGFNAIWISPVQANGPKGYHGYHYQNIYEINEHFGTKQDFKDLVEACHSRDIWVMVDTVPNHVAPVPGRSDFSNIVPFNDPKYYHFPIIDCGPLFKEKSDNQTAMEICWLWNLPDLNHENEFVHTTLIDWIHQFIEEYKVDGLRLDAVRHVPQWFWKEFSEAAGVFTMGEVFHEDIAYVASYQTTMDSLLNFPLQERLYYAFHDGGSMTKISSFYKDAAPLYPDMTVLGNFVENHDMPRFLNENPDVPGFKAFYSFVICSIGIPSLYYGGEQLFDGGVDPENREPLFGKMDTNSEMYQYLKTMLNFRQKTEFYKYDQVERDVDDSFYSFSRGQYFFAFTNSEEDQLRVITSHSYQEGTILCNALNEKQCTEVKHGTFQIVLKNKEVKILYPQNPDASAKKSVWKNINELWTSGFAYANAKIGSFWRTNKN